MSKVFVPTDQTVTSTSSASPGNSPNSDTTLPVPTPFPNRGVGKVTVNINGGVAASADADVGIGNSGSSHAWIECLQPGAGWTTVDDVIAFASNGGSADNSSDGPYVVELIDVKNLNDIENRIRCRTTASVSQDAGAGANAGITSWTISVNLKSSGILAA